MAFYEGTRERQLSTLTAMESQARTSLTRAREKQAQTGELIGPGPSVAPGVIMGAGSQRQTRNREAFGDFRSWVYVCVDAIARRLASQELAAGEIENAEENPDRDRATRVFHKHTKPIFPAHRAASVPRSTLKGMGANQQLNVYESHAALDLLSRPNPVQRKFEFLYMSAVNLLLTGECYWIGDPKGAADGGPEVWAVPTTWVTPVHDNGLFSSYLLQIAGQAVAKKIPAEMVARTYFADPSGLKTAYSPLRAISQSIRVDDYIQESQKQLFERGINPNLIVTVGRVRGEDGSLTDRRPVLTGSNRRQIIRSIREIWNQTVSAGDPAILDGLIESVHKLHNTPQEMDWGQSGEIVKKRVMQGYKVNPIVVGEVTAGNRAQAVEAEKNFCSNAVNPIGNALSETATDFVGPWYDTPARLVLWIEEATPVDPEQQLREWTEARKNEDVTRDEFRANILGIPPLSDREDPAKLANQQGGVQGIAAVTKQIATREITPEQGSKILQVTLRLNQTDADLIAGVGQPLPELPAPPPPQPAEDPPDDDDGNDGGGNDNGEASHSPSGNKRIEARKAIQTLARKQAAKLEGGLGRSMAEHFRRGLRACARQIETLDLTPDPDNAEVQAGWIVQHCFDPEQQYLDTVETAMPYVGQAFARGVFDELRLLHAVQKAEAAHGTKTTAEDILAQYDIELPPGVSVGEAPLWFREAADEFLSETFQRDYWTDIDITTASDIQDVLQDGIQHGWSIPRMAQEINSMASSAYSLTRATLVARTEANGALNAGHQAGIEGTARETGLAMGKEWVSVMGNTTRHSHADADGQQTATPDGLFTVGGEQAPYPGHGGLSARERCHCQCHPDGVLVDGVISAAARMFYSGPLVELETATGAVLHATPNHPVLTTQGLIPAGEVHEGQELVQVQRGPATPGSDDERDKPAAIQDIFQAIGANTATVESVRVVPHQFHGDAIHGQGEIQIVRPQDHLRAEPISERRRERSLRRREAGMGGVENAAPVTFGRVSPPRQLSFGIGSQLLTLGTDRADHRGSRDPQPPGDFHLGRAGSVKGDNSTAIDTRAWLMGTGSNEGVPDGVLGAAEQGGDRADGQPLATQLHAARPVAGRQLARRCADRTNGNTSLAEQAQDNHGAEPVTAADGILGLTRLIAGNDIPHDTQRHVDAAGGKGPSGNGLLVTADRVVGVRVRQFTGHVYSLQAEQGWYLANGYAVSNCTVISSLVMEAVDQASEDQQAGRDVDSLDQAALNEMPAKDIVASHKGLEAKRQKLFESREKYRAKRAALKAEQDEAFQDAIELTHRKRQVLEEGFELEDGVPIPEDIAELMAGDLQEQANEKLALMDKLTKQMDELDAGVRTSYWKTLGVPTKKRAKIKSAFVTKAQVSKDPDLRDWVEDGYRRSTGRVGNEQRKRAKEATDFYTMMLDVPEDRRKSKRITDVRIHIADDEARAFHAGIQNYTNATSRQGINMARVDLPRTYVHEMGHHFEDVTPGVRKRANEFIDYRLAKSGKPNRKLKDVFGGGYKDYEVGNDDDFMAAFDRSWQPGKQYTRPYGEMDYDERRAYQNAFYTGKKYSHGPTELISMGTELLFSDPHGFAERDPEFFKFIVGVLDGTIR